MDASDSLQDFEQLDSQLTSELQPGKLDETVESLPGNLSTQEGASADDPPNEPNMVEQISKPDRLPRHSEPVKRDLSSSKRMKQELQEAEDCNKMLEHQLAQLAATNEELKLQIESAEIEAETLRQKCNIQAAVKTDEQAAEYYSDSLPCFLLQTGKIMGAVALGMGVWVGATSFLGNSVV